MISLFIAPESRERKSIVVQYKLPIWQFFIVPIFAFAKLFTRREDEVTSFLDTHGIEISLGITAFFALFIGLSVYEFSNEQKKVKAIFEKDLGFIPISEAEPKEPYKQMAQMIIK